MTAKSESTFSPFGSASIWRLHSPDNGDDGQLSFSRAYTLSLSPQLIYTRSRLLPSLVSSRVYRQLDFQAMGNWWVYRGHPDTNTEGHTEHGVGGLHRVPGSREDVFADDTLTMKSKRSLMKFLRYLGQSDEEGNAATDEELEMPFAEFLRSRFQVPLDLYDPLLSLCLSPHSSSQTTTGYALPKIKRHLQSIGVFGSGFCSVLSKWGGGSEVAQVACRACAVGGGVYALNKGIGGVTIPVQDSSDDTNEILNVRLTDGETVCTKYVVGSASDLPADVCGGEPSALTKISRCIMIVSSPLETLFPATSENGPVPAGTVVVFPGRQNVGSDGADEPPLYLILHSSDTGECPAGQSKFLSHLCFSQ